MSLPPIPPPSTHVASTSSSASSSSHLPPRPSHLPAPPTFSTAMPDLAPPGRDSVDRYTPSYDSRDSRENGGRGAGQSRDYDAGDRKRRRSPSPVGRGGDREPRDGGRPRYEDARGDSSIRHNSSRPAMRPIGPDPDLLDHIVSFNDWNSWFRATNPQKAEEDDDYDRKLNDIAKPKKSMERYEAYKKRFLSRQLYGLFLYHKSSQWFVEKYSPKPEFVAERERVRKVARKGKEQAFLKELEEDGAFAFGDDSWGLDEKKEDPLDEALDVIKDGKIVDNTRQGLVTATPAPHQVFIKTIPPNISRADLEKICSKAEGYVSLSLGPPQEKKNFHRVGWVNFVEGTDMAIACSTLDGSKVADPPFILHMSISSESYVSRPKYAPQGTSRLERLEKDLEQARKLALLLEEEEKDSVPEGSVRGSERIDELGREAAKSLEGRAGGGTSIEERKQLTKFKLDLFILYLRRAFYTCYYSASVNDSVEELERRSIQYLRRLPSPPASVEGADKDKDKSKKKPSEEVEEEGEERRKEEVVVPMKVDDEDGDVAEFGDEVDEAKAGKGEEKDTVMKDLASTIWEKELDSKLSIVFNRATLDPADVGGKNVDEEVTRLTSPHIKQEAEGKFRCKACTKLFKAADFLKKHIPAKHPDLVKDLDDLPYFNSFILDPLHISPPPGAPASINNQPPVGARPPITVSSLPQPTPPWMNPSLPSSSSHHQHPSTGYTPGFVGFQPPPGGGVFNQAFVQNRQITGRGGNPPAAMNGGARGPGGGMSMSLMDRVGAMVPGEPEVNGPGREMLDTTLGRPEGMKDDPRAKRGRVTYADLDSSPGDVGDEMMNY